MTEELNPKEARQGNNSRRILTVLIISIAAALVAWGIAEIYYEAALEPQVEDADPGAS